MNAFLVTGSPNGIKSIPIHKLPEDAWRYITGQAQYGDDKQDVYSLYERVAWLYRGVEARCNALGGVPMAVHKGGEEGEEIPEHNLPFEIALSDLLNTVYRHYILSGAWYIWIQRSAIGTVQEVRTFHPRTMTPKYDQTYGLVGFKRSLGGNVQEQFYPAEDVGYLLKPSHKDETGIGVPDAVVALRAAGVLANMDVFSGAYFEQGAINPTIISVTDGTSEPDKARIQDWYRRTLTKLKNAFTVNVVSGEVKATTIGYPLKDLAAKELTDSKREDVATALGVPQSILFSNAANFATANQDDLHFYDKTVLPDGYRFVRELNRYLFTPLGYHLKLHPERMEIYQKWESEKAYAVTALVQSEIMERYEARENFNLSPVPTPPDGWEAYEKAHPQKVKTNKLGTPDSPEELVAELVTPEESKAVKFIAELGQWEKMARNRFKENKPHKARDFKAERIPNTLAAAIRGQLSTAKADDLTGIFANARAWVGYP